MAVGATPGLLQVPSRLTGAQLRPAATRPARRAPPPSLAVRASAAARDHVLEPFRAGRALKIISGLQNYDKENVASVVTAAEKKPKAAFGFPGSRRKTPTIVLGSGFQGTQIGHNLARELDGKGGATHVDIACDEDLVKLALELTSLPICVSAVDPSAFHPAVEAGAQMVEIGNYDSFYERGIKFSSEQILKLTRETRKMLPHITLSVTVPHTLSLPDQVRLAELLEEEGADIIQTEGGKCSSPTKPGVLGLIEKATPTIAAAYSISEAVGIPVMCSSGLSSVTARMARAMGASGVGVGSAVNKLNDVVAMIAEVRSIAEALGIPAWIADKEMQGRRRISF